MNKKTKCQKIMGPKQKQKKGQALSEYLIICALIAVASIGVIQILSKNLRSRLTNVANAIGGDGRTDYRPEVAGERNHQIRDLNDFTVGIQENENH